MAQRKAVESPATLLDLAPDQAGERLLAWAKAAGLPEYRARQALPRLWQRSVASWEEASDLPKELRAALTATFPLPRLELITEQVSSDGTRKYLWRLADGEAMRSSRS